MRELCYALMAILLLPLPGCIGSGTPDGYQDGTNTTVQRIHTFDDCARYYLVLESYPRRCMTPDGRSFTSDKDAFDAWFDASCVDDSDCVLVDGSLGLSCCYAGACKEVDHSSDDYVAASASWYRDAKDSVCPDATECGPSPLCPVHMADQGYRARCEAGICIKEQIEGSLPTSDDSETDDIDSGSEDPASGPQDPAEPLPGGAIVFGGGRYVLVLEDAMMSGCPDGAGGAFMIRYRYLEDVLGRESVCPVDSFYWTSPDGDEFRIRVEEVGAGYTGQSYAQVSIFGEASVDLGSLCCSECSAAFSLSPISMGPEGVLCGPFTSGDPVGSECLNYFEENPETVSSCQLEGGLS